jgi:hypothetical protein
MVLRQLPVAAVVDRDQWDRPAWDTASIAGQPAMAGTAVEPSAEYQQGYLAAAAHILGGCSIRAMHLGEDNLVQARMSEVVVAVA